MTATHYDGGLSLPSTVLCKVSSESAGYVTMSRVSRVEVPLHDLVGRVLGFCGKNCTKVAGILARGAMVSGDMRYRWESILVEEPELAAYLDRFPDYEPDRTFDSSRCDRILFVGERGEFEISREAGIRRRLFRRKVFWDDALAILDSLGPRCERYSFTDEADVFVAELTSRARERLREIAGRLRFTALEGQIRGLPSGRVSLFVRRPDAS